MWGFLLQLIIFIVMKLIITEGQVERFGERMAYIDKVIKNQMREGGWTNLERLVERYGLTQEDVDIIAMIERNILDKYGWSNNRYHTPQILSYIIHSDDDFTFTIDEVTPKTYNNGARISPHHTFNLDMNLPRFVLKGSLVTFNKELENDQTWLDHVLDLMISIDVQKVIPY